MVWALGECQLAGDRNAAKQGPVLAVSRGIWGYCIWRLGMCGMRVSMSVCVFVWACMCMRGTCCGVPTSLFCGDDGQKGLNKGEKS